MSAGRRPGGRERSAMGALMGLDDHLLADIGLRRAEVVAVASGQLPVDQMTLDGPADPGDLRPPASEPAAGERAAPEPWDVAPWDAAA